MFITTPYTKNLYMVLRDRGCPYKDLKMDDLYVSYQTLEKAIKYGKGNLDFPFIVIHQEEIVYHSTQQTWDKHRFGFVVLNTKETGNLPKDGLLFKSEHEAITYFSLYESFGFKLHKDIAFATQELDQLTDEERETPYYQEWQIVPFKIDPDLNRLPSRIAANMKNFSQRRR